LIRHLYIEEAVTTHPRVQQICERYPKAARIVCERYGQVFNRKAQSFRLQKSQPSMILAQKFDGFVLPAPPGYGVGSQCNYYFSHMLNCIYDCRYCFLQGMYRSAHYVVFVNYEDFVHVLDEIITRHDGSNIWFFSGYDCDSLALEPVTGFVDFILPVFESRPSAYLELRTKSTQVRLLCAREPLPNVVVAFSFTPEEISLALEHKVPSVSSRIEAMLQLQERGWNLGLRFDPIIYTDAYREQYERLFCQVFDRLKIDSLRSVSLGAFRLPKQFHINMLRSYPEEPLFAGPLNNIDGMIGYRKELVAEMMGYCEEHLLKYIPRDIYFPCEVTT